VKPAVKPAASRAPEVKAKRPPAPVQAKVAEVIPPQRLKVAKAEPKFVPVVDEPEEEEPSKGKNPMMMMIIGAVVVVALILAVAIPMMLRKAPEKTAQVAMTQPVVSYTADAPPSATPAGTQTQSKPTPAAPLQTTAGTPATTAPEAQTPSVQPDMMNSQLNAPSRISSDIKSPNKDTAPPPTSFGAGGLEGLGGSSGTGVGTVFGGQSGPKVKIATPRFVTISSGVAQGMLVQRTTPVYPPIAKTARVAGTVVLEATISKNGMVEGLRVVSGPEMLRQSAVDAVRTWRYKPYKLNNEPVEVETTVNVVFSLGG
jgi:protein TonB